VRWSSIPGAGRRGRAGGRASPHPFQALHRSLLTGNEKVSAGDVVGGEMAEDFRELVTECFASIGAAMAETALSVATRSRSGSINGQQSERTVLPDERSSVAWS